MVLFCSVDGEKKTHSLTPISSAIVAIYVTANNIHSSSHVYLTFSGMVVVQIKDGETVRLSCTKQMGSARPSIRVRTLSIFHLR